MDNKIRGNHKRLWHAHNTIKNHKLDACLWTVLDPHYVLLRDILCLHYALWNMLYLHYAVWNVLYLHYIVRNILHLYYAVWNTLYRHYAVWNILYLHYAVWNILYPMLGADSRFWLANNHEVYTHISLLMSSAWSAWNIMWKEHYWWRLNGDHDRCPLSLPLRCDWATLCLHDGLGQI